MKRILAVCCLLFASQPSATSAAEDTQFFETRIRPMLVKHCYECHSSAAAEVEGGFVLDFRDGIRKGGESGPAVVPGDPDKSLLLEALRYESLEMPPAGKLNDAVIADFQRWIRGGAVDPRDKPPSPADAAEAAWKAKLAERSRWWSLQPPQHFDPPTVANEVWSEEPVDRFILAKLQEAELSPATKAGAETLLRRLSFVLTGLPPKHEKVIAFREAFEKDDKAAVETLVDELLDSPHFGERFARHWMDVVRYTDTYGYEWDIPARGSWEYRDYLIRAFNDDIPFDRLLREQIAGDLLPRPRINHEAGVNESLIGPMFYHMGEHRHGSSLDFNGIHQEMVNNKIDAFSKAFLAMTVACSRCHDHKLDAISQADYYALAGVFMSPRWVSRSIDAPGLYDRQIGELKRLREEIRQGLAQGWKTNIGDGNQPAFKKAALQGLGDPIAKLLSATDDKIAEVWRQLAAEWKTANATSRKSNERFAVLTDFSQPGFPEGWVVEGAGIEHGYVSDGMPLVSLEGDSLVSQLLPRGYHTHALSSKLPGAVRLPAPEKFPKRFVSLKLKGGEWAGRRTVPQNAFLSEGPIFFDPLAAPAWTGFSTVGMKNGVTRVLTEITTASLNPNFPPRTGVARSGKIRLPDDDEGHNKRSWFSVTGIVAHDAGGTPADGLDHFSALYDSSLYDGEEPSTAEAVWRRVAEWCSGSVQRWIEGKATQADVTVLNLLLEKKLLANDANSLPKVAALVEEYRRVESEIGFPRGANSMDERHLEPINYRLNPRGNVDEDGPAIPRRFLEVFDGKNRVSQSSGSGRLELANYLANRENPQTARVYVNRVWQWIFGTGLVATPSDFGKLGDRPSHPELLDWLAIRFMEEGWSTKKLVRRLVLSQTFRQSGEVVPQAAELDPNNRLLHHYPTRRLEAEGIRDSLLAVSGRLDRKLYGPAINPPRPAEDSKKRLFSGPLDSNGRRSLYIEMSIMEPPKFLVGFNLPDLKLPTGRRDVTNVPAQALIMLNHPLVTDLADHWGKQLVEQGPKDARERIRHMFLSAFGREPSQAESDRWLSAAAVFSASNKPLENDIQAWSEIAHAFFNAKEFIYYR